MNYPDQPVNHLNQPVNHLNQPVNHPDEHVNYPKELDGITFEKNPASGVASITLDVPGKLNRVSMLARGHLSELFKACGEDPDVQVVMLAGAGIQAFTAGGDITGFLKALPKDLTRLHHNVAAPERCPKPVIAKLAGYTFGVGLELALACDFRLAADNLVLGQPEISLGMIPGSGGTQRLARMIGLGRAKDLIMTGRRMHADEALHVGLVSRVVPFDELDAAAYGLAADLCRLSPLALSMAKRVLNQAYEAPISVGLELEGLAYGFMRTTDDFREGVEAFAEKRRPRFTGG